MKHRPLLSTIVLLGCLAGSPGLRADDDASHKAAAIELLQAMHSERALESVSDRIAQAADRFAPLGRTSATPEEQAALRTSLQQQAKDILKDQLKWSDLEKDFAQLYVADFTEAELRQLIEFYKTPLGQKLLDKQPEVATKMSQITQQKMRAVMPVLSQQLRASTTKFRDEHPAPALGAGAPGAPGKPVVPPLAPPTPAASAPVAPPPAASTPVAPPAPAPTPTPGPTATPVPPAP